MQYIEYVQMFNTEPQLLERMTRDIAEYFIERSARLREDNDLKGALQRLQWAKKLWHQYDKMQQEIKTDELREVRVSQRMIEINKLIAEVEALIPPVEAPVAKVKTELRDKPSDDKNASSDEEEKGCQPA